MAEQLSYFLDRLSTTPEGDGTLLDRTLVLYGSSNSVTHNNTNYPLVLAGGSKLGLDHGRFLKFDSKIPMANLFVTMLSQMGIPCDQFADSTGPLSELVV